jgi:hypothetical protein
MFRVLREPAVIVVEKHHTSSNNTGGDHFVTLARLCPQVYSDIAKSCGCLAA